MKGKKSKKQKKNTPAIRLEYIALTMIIVSLFTFFSWGFIGVFMSNITRLFVGDLYHFSSILLFLYGFYVLIQRKWTVSITFKQSLGLIILSLIILTFTTMITLPNKTQLVADTWQALSSDLFSGVILRNTGGGFIGAIIANICVFLFSEVGTYIVLFLLLGIVVTLLTGLSVLDLLSSKKGAFSTKQTKEKKIAIVKKEETKAKLSFKQKMAQFLEEDESETVSQEEPVVIRTFNDVSNEKRIDAPEQTLPDNKQKVDDVVKEVDREVNFSTELEKEDYQLPPVHLLKQVVQSDQSNEHALIKKNSQLLEETFKSFGVNARVISANLGPSVTKFEVQPAVGVKVNKIVSLADDLALALAAKDIRIEAPIPGKSYVGIEVPNQTVTMVSFREIIEDNIYSSSKLEVPIGRDISGNIRMADLSKMPHLLVAGATGSGKSVAINGMITSILMKAKPSEVKLMMVDPKKVELNVYNGIPHLLTPVVTNPRRAAQALQKVVMEMERRYEVFAQTGMRNIIGYNEYVDELPLEERETFEKMPYIVVIVDELADLMMVASNEVESAIIRLAQMARAAGIHMVLATQRPSVDVITGLIKANVPSRMAFAVSSSIDSRTIIDTNGAEKLLGKGDMLFQPMGESKPIRVQGAYLSDSEVEKIVSFVKNQQGANYVEEMMPSEETAHALDTEDELFAEVLEFVKTQEFISVSMLQRRFRIGFNRAARLMDDLETKNIVGAAEGTKPRRVLVFLEEESN